MQIRIDTHLNDVVVTLEPHAGPKQIPTGAKYVWRMDPDEAVRVGEGLLKAAKLIEGHGSEHGSRTQTQKRSPGAQWQDLAGASRPFIGSRHSPGPSDNREGTPGPGTSESDGPFA
jgi:hypothetical protein